MCWEVLGLGLLTLAGCQQLPPSLTFSGSATGSRLDSVFVSRRGVIVPVGDLRGLNTSGALPEDTLFTAEGNPIGGQEVPVWLNGVPSAQPTPIGDGGADDAGVGSLPPSLVAPRLSTATPNVTLRDWWTAQVSVTLTPLSSSSYTAALSASGLIPNGLYSAWFVYYVNAPNALIYAVAPVGDLPNFFLADEQGNAVVQRTLSSRYITGTGGIPNAIRVGKAEVPAVVTSTSSVAVEIDYHSSGQTNGNSSFSATDVVPAGKIGMRGRVGYDLHPQVQTRAINIGHQ